MMSLCCLNLSQSFDKYNVIMTETVDITVKIRLEAVINQNEAVTEDQHSFQRKNPDCKRDEC